MTAGRAPLRSVAVIPARLGSTRLPEKMLLAETGRPLVVHVLERVKQARRLAEVIVATDDPRIQRAVEAAGGVARITRADHTTGSDRVGELLPSIQADVIVNVQGDEPEVDPGPDRRDRRAHRGRPRRSTWAPEPPRSPGKPISSTRTA